MSERKRFYKSEEDRILFGVCGGIAERFDTNVTYLRILWVSATAFTLGTWLVFYLILALVLPNKSKIYPEG